MGRKDMEVQRVEGEGEWGRKVPRVRRVEERSSIVPTSYGRMLRFSFLTDADPSPPPADDAPSGPSGGTVTRPPPYRAKYMSLRTSTARAVTVGLLGGRSRENRGRRTLQTRRRRGSAVRMWERRGWWQREVRFRVVWRRVWR